VKPNTHGYGRASHLAEINIPEEIVDQQLLYAGKMIFRFRKYQLEKPHDLKLKYIYIERLDFYFTK
jgi:hypothetical protein